MTNPINL